MLNHLRPALVMIGLATVVLGLVYPLALTGMAQVLFPTAARGSLVVSGGKVVGSTLIGQAFAAEKYFRPRPSAAGENGYDASASSGSNLGPTSKKLVERVEASVVELKGAGVTGPIPADAVTASASGLDPHISPAFARLQVERVARARGVDPARVEAVLDKSIRQPAFGFIGEPLVNVLDLNRRLDAELPMRSG